MFSPEVGEINTHVQAVYTSPSPPPILEGLDIKCAQDKTKEQQTGPGRKG